MSLCSVKSVRYAFKARVSHALNRKRDNMLPFNTDDMLFTIPPEKHGSEDLKELLGSHPEVQFVSFVGVDMGGHDTDEKIPVGISDGHCTVDFAKIKARLDRFRKRDAGNNGEAQT